MRRYALFVLMLAALAALVPALEASAVTDFSLISNPQGPWSYGYTTALDGSFTLFTNSSADYFGDGKARDWSAPAGLPAVLQNTTGGNITEGTIVYWPNDILLMHPGSTGQYAVVRYTAPVTASYIVTGLFVGMDNGPTTTDVYALLNGASEGTVPINGYDPASLVSIFGTLNLSTGDHLDFLVGYGSDGNYSNDSTGFNADISAVPEPAAFALLGSGLLALVVGARRRRRY